jgi:glycosyltransferase involved in cell wall biosynthesis
MYGRGVSQYTANLVTALMRQDDVTINAFGSSLRQRLTLETFVSKHKLKSRSKLYTVPPKAWPLLWYKLNWPPIETFIPKPTDVFHAWEELIPPSKDTPVVATIHDLAMLKFPETANPSTLAKHQAAWKRLKETDAHVIAVSQATKKDVIEMLGFKPEKVHLVYEALPEEHQLTITNDEAAEALRRMGLNRPFILFVGAVEPRKNVERLIEAWIPFQNDLDLVIAGKPGWGTFLKEVPGLKLVGSVSNKQLVALYKRAQVFAYPSLYEGFGLPILEAFTYGTPVLTSQNSAMSEISGNASLLVNPLEVESITKGLNKLLNEKGPDKEHRRQAMKLQLQLFSWDRTAEKTIKVYKRAFEEKK